MSTTPIYDRLFPRYFPTIINPNGVGRVQIDASSVYSTTFYVTNDTTDLFDLMQGKGVLLKYQKETTTKGEHHDTELPAPLVRTSEGKGRCC